ncbi:multidrug resistance efflux pump [Extensimonas vulgaris]|uniref:Multidrug resistance efflux pump n=2 Tax=Extensimonas vulgaris TaxID=1031594 RepID=A0A369AGN9_9BURK|nr:HlyD family secretion protein [Extensimonas vulgaris]RCX08265.1 multidrug resistance efflux pump [Extensimonas vulgaris]TWI37463.1 multidrug resistance efflux pump [Extensimonas vulgaris]TXD13882.1 HlyD family secretion protein [Extensimonas vulgaris]
MPPSITPAERRKRLIMAFVFALIALLGVVVVLYAWELPPFTTPIESTENAQVRGQVTLISPQVSGYVVDVLVQDFQTVHRGDLLVQIDERIYRQRVAQGEAQVAAAKAALANFQQQRRSAEATIAQAKASVENAHAQALKAEADWSRIKALVADGSLSERERDQTFAAHAQAMAGVTQSEAALRIAQENLRTVEVNRGALEAAVANAQAALQLARIDLANTEIRAARDGRLGQVNVRVGAYVTAGTQLTALVPQPLWVIANMKETQMANVAVGQPAWFTVDALNHARLTGYVERISPAAGSEFSVIPPDNATGNFVKIAQRIPVRIAITPDQPLAERLRPGMSVVASINTAGKATPSSPADRPAPDAARAPESKP